MRSPASLVTAVAVVVLAVVAGVGAVALADRSGEDAPVALDGSTTFGLLAPTTDQVPALAGGPVTRVTVGATWSALEPAPGRFDADALAALTDRIAGARSHGLEVVLDLGLQYPPVWVFDLGAGTRFVNQYGDVWHGPLSEDVPNAVFAPRVRDAQARYVGWLGERIGPAGVAAVRVGGLLRGEVRFPPSEYRGHDDSLWAFDRNALAASPVPDWRPGTGSEADARRVLGWYLASMSDYLRWLLDVVTEALPDVGQQVLLPSWGIRPGMVDQAVATRFGPETPTDVADLVASGVDWAAQVPLLAARAVRPVVYTTWLDAPDNGPGDRREAPVAYLASLAGPLGLPLGGENTGGGGQAALHRTLQQAHDHHLQTVMFMSGGFIADGQAGVTLPQLLAAVRPS